MEAFIIVDIQNDFCPGGSLEVKEGDKVIPVINELQKEFDLIVATQDWHPEDHMSFARNHKKKPGGVVEIKGIRQILWPDHCVQFTHGADFHRALKLEKIARVFQKGTDKWIDSYSCFFDNVHQKSTGLGDYLGKKGVRQIYIAGLATDYCVLYSAMDGVKLGFETYVIEDACRGVDLKPGDSFGALQEMRLLGVKVIRSRELLA